MVWNEIYFYIWCVWGVDKTAVIEIEKNRGLERKGSPDSEILENQVVGFELSPTWGNKLKAFLKSQIAKADQSALWGVNVR